MNLTHNQPQTLHDSSMMYSHYHSMERGRTLRRRSSFTEQKFHDRDILSPIRDVSRSPRRQEFIVHRNYQEISRIPENEYESHPCDYDYAMNDTFDYLEDFYGPLIRIALVVVTLITIFLIAVIVEIIMLLIRSQQSPIP